MRSYGIRVFDNPFTDGDEFGIETESVFIPFTTIGTNITFESRVPTAWEKKHLPVIILTDREWDPHRADSFRRAPTREIAELRTIHSLTSGLTRMEISAIRSKQMNSQAVRHGEVESTLGEISNTFHPQSFCDRLIGAVNIATTYRSDMDQQLETEKEQRRIGLISNERHSKVTPEELARKWNIGIQTAKDTLRVTTQRGVRTAVHPMTRRLRVDHLHLHRKRLAGTWYCDTLFSKTKSKLGNTCANVFTQGKFTSVFPMTARKESGQSLIDFTDDIGIPENLVTDQAGEFTGKNTLFVREARKMRIRLFHTEKGRKNQNHAAEREIAFLAKRWRLRMAKKKVPKRLWDFGLKYEAEILSRMSRGRDGRTGYEEVTGETADISEHLDFEMYDLVWWLDRGGPESKPSATDDPRRLGRWLGVSHRVGSDLCYWLITDGGKLVSKTSVEHVIRDDYLNPDKKKQIDEFNEKLETLLDDKNFKLDGDDGLYMEDLDLDDNNGIPMETNVKVETVPDNEYGDDIMEERPEDDDEEAIDKYLNVELILDLGSTDERRGRVVKRSRGLDGEPIGRAHSNPLLDTREYEVEFTDGTKEKYMANVIAENMFAQVDDEGKQYLMLKEIVDHKSDETAITKENGYTESSNGNRIPKITSRGWLMLVLWRDGSMSWVKLKDLKDSNPIELAEYAVANRIDEEPAFKWWVPHIL